MCGIVGYVGSGGPSGRPLDVVLEGLRRLEYRGYDSAGVALVVPGGELATAKKAGKLANLVEELEQHPLPPATAAIGHTRWATHGGPTDANAHPHVAGRLAVIHNGIVENFAALKAELLATGAEFLSETDTEVVAHLVARAYDESKDLTAALTSVSRRLDGTFTLLAVHADAPDTVVGARHDSPLVVGLGDGENFLGSDVAAFIGSTRRALELGQDQVVTITPTSVEVTDLEGNPVEAKPFTVDWDTKAAEKGGYRSFMEKEIHDQPHAVADTLLGRLDVSGLLTLDEMRIDESVLRSVDKIVVVACGTAAYAGHVAKYAIEHWCRIPVEVELAHEFRYRDPVVDDRTLVVAVSQSGETMDTLMAVRHAREQGATTLAIVNTHGSTIPRESDAVLYTHAGPEIAVASTKAFLAQITAAYLLGLYLAQLRGNKFPDEIATTLGELRQMPDKIQQVLDRSERVREIARWMADTQSVLFLGRHVGFPVALEGALKLKELAYIHAEGFAAGELKHGPIALIEPGQPVFVIVPSPRGRNSLHSKVVSNIQEIRARGARTLVVAEDGDDAVVPYADEVFFVPQTSTLLAPLLAVVPLQIFASELATAKGLDVDQPRNLAKSVTVE
ncbi:glutamine--fructose-6-phosphate transaminase (isomerizing) [Cellulomonas wangsupingiae]|uniref:Glutamine--fructose-6-phosphate aminotransferase [isomerizing] n=1 Tax=Cellulomonas wangsupingiae TaxID=2968085 RepID=A0ABY5K152_9CELL|nr:glutamine--fructose-6-phosphate transaminase (isomerizing) [Cellulomonas wangsupingiae]MCC2335933.1 glutamine--fructose-6-phosphate transaminase (isomerizing) [Cellulomonas wangsupingiae]MCM0639778.1 glutamine--fructose-6-phosphate transaminase (isomerizing) [Cellulomonas wangsupingiae]UUI64157.1 glutamine--fructose-6-phosphate transaminase (isomerizing) [Cellulomonas wangsupingiae]